MIIIIDNIINILMRYIKYFARLIQLAITTNRAK